MIGLIGPDDSIEVTQRVAEEDGIVGGIVVRRYVSVTDAPALAREIDPVCNVLVFTGLVPYTLAVREGEYRALLDYVPHEGGDLYPVIVRLLQEHKGKLPAISLDTLERGEVEEAFDNVGLPVPEHVLSLDVEGEDLLTMGDPASLTAYHERLYRSGEVRVCVTCMGAVHDRLTKLGVPSLRIEHSKSSLREALRRASLASRLARSEATQIGAVRVEFLDEPPGRRSQAFAHARDILLERAERLRGALTETDDDAFLIHTTRGAIEDALARLEAGHTSALDFRELRTSIAVGAGIGRTVASAEESARKATGPVGDDGRITVVFDDSGATPSTNVVPGTVRSRTNNVDLVIARRLGLGPLALTRLVAALRRLDPAGVTAQELAAAQGIEVRSARRLLRVLEDAGLASALGRQVGPGAGRPQTVYSVDVGSLMAQRLPEPAVTA